jgi:N-acetylmuramoyl-L-alanine amidase
MKRRRSDPFARVSSEGFGWVSPGERRNADLFLADLLKRPAPVARRAAISAPWSYRADGRRMDALAPGGRRLLDEAASPPDEDLPGEEAGTFVVVIDPGHGGSGIGTHGPGPAGLREQDVALDIAQRLAALLGGRIQVLLSGTVRVIMTRTADTSVGLPQRAQVAKDNHAAIFMSIHLNASTDPGRDQSEVWIARGASERSRKLARAVLTRLVAVTRVPDGGVAEKNYNVLVPSRHAPETAACLVEVAYLTNPAQAARLADVRYRQDIAVALMQGISDFLEPAAARAPGARPGEDAVAEEGGTPLKTVTEVLTSNQAHFRFVPIRSTFEDGGRVFEGTFWVFDDALKWIVPASEAGYEESYDVMIETTKNTALPRRRLWRLPCSAQQAQAAAGHDRLKMRQRDLAGAGVAPIDDAREESLLLTPRLYDLRFQQADLKLDPVTNNLAGANLMQIQEAPERGGPRKASNDYGTALNTAALRAFNARPAGSAFPSLLADPGKIWAADRRMHQEMTKSSGHKFRAAINYGWHYVSSGTLGTPAVTPGLRLVQGNGCAADRCHDEGHADYSQVLVLVAGWCLVKRPGGAAQWTKTSDVYRSPELHRLVSHEAAPLTTIKYGV